MERGRIWKGWRLRVINIFFLGIWGKMYKDWVGGGEMRLEWFIVVLRNYREKIFFFIGFKELEKGFGFG